MRDLAGLRVRVDREPEEAVVLRLARAHRLSVYDASYLELALREALLSVYAVDKFRDVARQLGAA